LDDETVKQIDQEILERKIEQQPKGGVTAIGVDEISHKKGHQYLTVITDLKAQRVVALEKDRKAESLERFFLYLGQEHCACIEAVALDRWKPFRKAVRKHCPGAAIIYDKFHIVGDCNDAVDAVRKRLARAADPELRGRLKHSRWAILKAPENLTERQRDKLKEVERHNRPLFRAYLLKEEFRHIYRMERGKGQSLENFVRQAGRAFDAWCHKVMYSRIPELKRFVRSLRKDRQFVLNYFLHRLTNGLTEGFNTVIRSIQRRANGYRDMVYFTLKVYQKAGVLR
jgi:transposase